MPSHRLLVLFWKVWIWFGGRGDRLAWLPDSLGREALCWPGTCGRRTDRTRRTHFPSDASINHRRPRLGVEPFFSPPLLTDTKREEREKNPKDKKKKHKTRKGLLHWVYVASRFSFGDAAGGGHTFYSCLKPMRLSNHWTEGSRASHLWASYPTVNVSKQSGAGGQ